MEALALLLGVRICPLEGWVFDGRIREKKSAEIVSRLQRGFVNIVAPEMCLLGPNQQKLANL